jgi:hypothetical protein
LPDDVESLITGIMGEGESSIYMENYGWVGSLTETGLSGTNGYWFTSTEDLEFSFNIPTADDQMSRKDKIDRIVPDLYTFSQSTYQAFYFIEFAEVNGEPLSNEDLIVAYNGDVVVGSRYWNGVITDVPAMGVDEGDVYDGYALDGDVISFKVLDASSNDLINMETNISTAWTQNGISILSLSETIIPEEISLSRAYPNPFNPVTMVTMNLPSQMEVDVTIHDMLGREIETLASGLYDSGNYELGWNANEHASGIYFIQMVAGGQKSIQKLMLVK